MARKNLTEVKEEKQLPISELIDSYGEYKAQESSIKKVIAEQNEKLKNYLRGIITEDADSISEDGVNYTATLKLRDDSKMNEEKLIEYLKKNKLAKGIVKKKEYVDEKAFEDAVYNGVITEEQLTEMDRCKDTKITEVLTVKKIKR